MEPFTLLIRMIAGVVALLGITGSAPPGSPLEQRRAEIAILETVLIEFTEIPAPWGVAPRPASARERLVRRIQERRAALAFVEQIPGGGAFRGECPALAHIPVQSAVFAGGLGWAVRPADGRMRLHEGLDLTAPTGTPVYAAYSGVVAVAGVRGGYGKAVYLNHLWGSTRYAHLDTISVEPGAVVVRGQEIGRLGATGLAGSPHLHFEVRRADGTVIDPLACL
jgi:murein DD-endopeptidase MepM/ murein hydrolase activator NlpD